MLHFTEDSPLLWLCVLQTQDEVKLLCRVKKKHCVHSYTIKYSNKSIFFSFLILKIPAVRGCTESLALVNSAMSFRGPPWARCCWWYCLSSERGRNRFTVLWYWTSTWKRRRQTQPSGPSLIRYLSHLQLVPCSTWGCLACCSRHNARLSCQTECGPRKLPLQSIGGNTAGHQTCLQLLLNREERLTFMIPAIPGSLQLLW